VTIYREKKINSYIYIVLLHGKAVNKLAKKQMQKQDKIKKKEKVKEKQRNECTVKLEKS
jgi:uncharacterized protein YueI